MVKEFRVDQNRVHDFQKRWLKRVAIILGVFFVPLTILLTIGGDARQKIIVVVVFSLGYVICLAAVIASMGKRKFESTRILIEEKSVTRTGRGLVPVRIEFGQIGKVEIFSHGFVIVRKGIIPLMTYHLGKRSLTSNFDVIFIPYLMHDYDLLKDFFLKKKYLDQ